METEVMSNKETENSMRKNRATLSWALDCGHSDLPSE